MSKIRSKDFKDITDYFKAISFITETGHCLYWKNCELSLKDHYDEWIENENKINMIRKEEMIEKYGEPPVFYSLTLEDKIENLERLVHEDIEFLSDKIRAIEKKLGNL